MESPTANAIMASTIDLPSFSIAEKSPESVTGMTAAIEEVEKLLDYSFNKKKLLEDALTHSSYTASVSYQRLEFLGDSALALAISSHIFEAYPDAEPGELSLILSANVSTEKLARVAVRNGLYKYLRHNASALHQRIMDFAAAVHQEKEEEVHGGVMKAPKVLADLVESITAAVYVDCGMSVEKLWTVCRGLLKPFITPDHLEKQPQPVTMLYEMCQKEGNQVQIKYRRKGEKTVASVYVDGAFVASSSSKQKENAKLHAAKLALQKLSEKTDNKINVSILGTRNRSDDTEGGDAKKLKVQNERVVLSKNGTDNMGKLSGSDEKEGAKQKLHELCDKKRWPRPSYRLEKQTGPAHERRYVCSVKIEIVEAVLHKLGEEKSRVKDAESSAASAMLQSLHVPSIYDLKIMQRSGEEH